MLDTQNKCYKVNLLMNSTQIRLHQNNTSFNALKSKNSASVFFLSVYSQFSLG